MFNLFCLFKLLNIDENCIFLVVELGEDIVLFILLLNLRGGGGMDGCGGGVLLLLFVLMGGGIRWVSGCFFIGLVFCFILVVMWIFGELLELFLFFVFIFMWRDCWMLG